MTDDTQSDHSEQLAAAARYLQALEKLPPVEGIVFQGAGAEPWGGIATTYGFTATSLDPRVATENFASRSLIAIITRTARSVQAFAQHPAEQEVVLLPGSVLRSVGTIPSSDGSVQIFIIEELAAPLDGDLASVTPEEVLTVVRDRVDAALRGAPVRVFVPGKFTAPLPLNA